MSEQKTVEELTRELNKIGGECTYYKNLSGRYQRENHKNYCNVRKYKKLFYIALSVAIFNLIAAAILGIAL